MAQFNGRAKLEEAPVTKDKKTGKSKPKSPRVRVFYSNGKNPKELDFLLSPEQWPYDLELARQGCEVTVLVENGRVIKVAPKGVKIKYTPEKPKGSGLRDATANYNFVDYDEKRVINAEDTSTELYSGKIVCSLSTKEDSPLLVAGPFNEDNEEEKTKERKFLNVNNEPVISGSSLKGMIRALVEVMSYSSAHHVSKENIFFREITAKEGGKGASYYKKFIGKARAGFVKKVGAKWSLKEAKVELLETESDFISKPKHHKFHSVGGVVGKGNNQPPKYYDFTELDDGKEFILSDEVVGDFIKQKELSKAQKNFWNDNNYEEKLSKDPLGVPFFFATSENNPNEISAIGLVRYFRIPYELTPAQVAGEVSYKDFSSRLFGFAEGNKKAKGKVSIGSLTFKEGNYKNYEPFDATLLTPHPSCLAHYLMQDSDSILRESNDTKNKVETLIHYLKSDNPKIRGRKFYWHRDFQKQVSENSNGNTGIISKLYPIVNASGDFEITVDRVSKVELGAIIMAIDLPKGCAHKLGSGKSLGMGSVRLEIKQFDVQEDSKKYESLEDRLNSFGKLQQEKFDSSKLTEYKDCFKCYVLTKLGEPSDDPSYYYEQKEINNLFKMLDYKNKPSNEKTKNMELKEFNNRKILDTIDKIYGNENSPFDE